MRRRHFLRGGAATLAAGAVAGCAALPRSGPTTAAMDPLDAEGDRALKGLVATLTADIAVRAPAPLERGFPQAFLAAEPIEPTLLGVDDRLDVTIWESVGGGVFSAAGGPTRIEDVIVDSQGRIHLPYLGDRRAVGVTPEKLREQLRAALEPLTLSPQVEVRLDQANSRLVALQGSVARPGVYPIERSTLRLTAMIARAGGVQGAPESIEATLTRNGRSGSALLAATFDDPRLDVALRPGDQIVLSPIRERFVALGASSVQAELPFSTRPFHLLSALAAARGLNDFDADPSGVFVLRYETPAFAESVLTGPPPPTLPPGDGRPIIYRLDLTDPAAVFVAQRFQMRDGDAIFITNAPLTELRKFLQLFNAVVTPVNTAGALPAL